MSTVTIIEPGYFSTIQDKGRFGFAKYGVPFSGAMDQTSYKLANIILNNDENDACIEWVFQPPALRFSEPTAISITGAFTTCFLNGIQIEMNRQIQVKKNDVFHANFCKDGKYGYVGIKGGFLSKVKLDSRSFFKPVTPNSVLHVDDKIRYKKDKGFTRQFSKIAPVPLCSGTSRLLVYKGPEFDQLNTNQINELKHSVFTVSGMANRMAILLEELLPNDLASMLTSPVLPGTVQLTPSGRLIVLMRDCQTTGGYPRILQLSEDAISGIAQKRIGEQFNFLHTDF